MEREIYIIFVEDTPLVAFTDGQKVMEIANSLDEELSVSIKPIKLIEGTLGPNEISKLRLVK